MRYPFTSLLILSLSASLAFAQLVPTRRNLFYVAPSGGGGATPTFVGLVEGSSTGISTTWNLTGTLNVATGDLVVVGAAGTVDATAVSVGGQACTKINVNTAEGYSVALWYLQNAAANAAATVTITCASGDFVVGAAANYSGAATSSVLDQSACNVAACNAQTDSATTHTTQNVTTTVANQVLIVFDVSWDDKTSHTAGSSWNKRTAAGTKTHCFLDRGVTSTGSYPAATVVTVNDSGDDGYYSLIGTFKAL